LKLYILGYWNIVGENGLNGSVSVLLKLIVNVIAAEINDKSGD